MKYIVTVVSISIISLIIESIIPSGKIRQYVIFAQAVILSMCIIAPAVKFVKDVKNTKNFFSTKIESDYGISLPNSNITIEEREGKTEKVIVDLSGYSNEQKSVAYKESLKKALSEIYSVKEDKIVFTQ